MLRIINLSFHTEWTGRRSAEVKLEDGREFTIEGDADELYDMLSEAVVIKAKSIEIGDKDERPQENQ